MGQEHIEPFLEGEVEQAHAGQARQIEMGLLVVEEVRLEFAHADELDAQGERAAEGEVGAADLVIEVGLAAGVVPLCEKQPVVREYTVEVAETFDITEEAA